MTTHAELKEMNRAAGHFYFSKDTMKYWNGKIHYTRTIDAGILFVDSICQDPGRTPRIYRVRFMETTPPHTGKVYPMTDETRHNYTSAKHARAAMLEIPVNYNPREN